MLKKLLISKSGKSTSAASMETVQMRELTTTEVKDIAGGFGVQWGHTHNSFWIKPFLGRRPGRG